MLYCPESVKTLQLLFPYVQVYVGVNVSLMPRPLFVGKKRQRLRTLPVWHCYALGFKGIASSVIGVFVLAAWLVWKRFQL